jgi:membrane protease YdiL (CAAX protease family)
MDPAGGEFGPEKVQDLWDNLPFLVLFAVVSGYLLWLVFSSPRSPLAPASKEPREPPLWGAAEVLIVFGTWFFVPLFLAIGTSRLLSEGSQGLSDFKDHADFIVGSVGQIVVCIVCLHLVIGRLGQPRETLGLASAPPRHYGGTVLLRVFSLLPLGLANVVWILFLHEAGIGIEEQEVVSLVREKFKGGDPLYIASATFLAVVMAPIVEEIVFRGLLFGWLRERWGTVAGAVISSLAFAAIHASLTALVALFLVALLLCAIYTRTRSLYPCMLYHAMLNGQTLLLLAFGPESLEGL